MASSRSQGGAVRIVTSAPGHSKRRRGIAGERDSVERVVQAKFAGCSVPRSDREVARNLGLSAQAVASMIERAYRDGIITTHVNLSCERQEIARLENVLRARFGLQQVSLVPGLPEMLDPLDERTHRDVHTAVLQAMARRVVQHLDEVVLKAQRTRSSFTMGVAWGRTMHRIVETLQMTPRDIRFPGLEVVPIVGITGAAMPEPTEANIIAMRVAEAYRGKSSQLACPAFVKQEVGWMIDQPEQVRQMLRRLPACDVVLTSMGPIPDDDKAARDITIASDPLLNPTLVKEARASRAIGEICYWMFDERGQEVRGQHTVNGLGFANLRAIADDPKRQVILVAGGDRRRFAPLRAALLGRLASVLVSDTMTARFLAGECD